MTIKVPATTTVTNSLIEGKYTEEHLLATAKSLVIKKTSDSAIFKKEAEDAVPKFEFNGTSIVCPNYR
jgi:hypothetical protein